MRIAIVTETWHPCVDGVVTRLVATVRELRTLGHELLLIAPRGGGGEFEGIPVREVPTFSVSFVYGGRSWGWPLPRVGRFVAEFEPDLVHVVNPFLVGAPAAFAARRRGIPLVASYHTELARYAGYYHLGWAKPLVWTILRQLHNRADLNLATSAAACEDITRHGIERVQLWRRGVDVDLFHPRRRSEATRRELTGGEPWRTIALYVGRIAEEKSLDLLQPLLESNADLQLVLVGEGPDRHRLARRLGDERTTFTGMLHGEELADVYAAADLFVFPSTTETLGLVLLEAMASGLPILAADSLPTRELLGESGAGRIFSTRSSEELPALVEAIVANGDWEFLSRAARSEAERWDWKTATAELSSRYERLVAARPSLGHSSPRRQLARFVAVGASNALVDVGVFNLLMLLLPTRGSWQLVAYNTVAVAAAIANSYLWNSRWTFRDTTRRHTRHRERLLFVLQSLLNLGINDAVLGGMATLLRHAELFSPVVGNNLAKLLAMFLASTISFVAMKLVVFG